MKKVSLLAVVALSCAFIMACNNTPAPVAEDDSTENAVMDEVEAIDSAAVETLAEPETEVATEATAAKPVKKSTAKKEEKKEGTATGSTTTDAKSGNNKVDASTTLIPAAKTSGTATTSRPESASKNTKKVSADMTLSK